MACIFGLLSSHRSDGRTGGLCGRPFLRPWYCVVVIGCRGLSLGQKTPNLRVRGGVACVSFGCLRVVSIPSFIIRSSSNRCSFLSLFIVFSCPNRSVTTHFSSLKGTFLCVSFACSHKAHLVLLYSSSSSPRLTSTRNLVHELRTSACPAKQNTAHPPSPSYSFISFVSRFSFVLLLLFFEPQLA